MSSLVEVPRTSLPARGLSAWHPQGGFRPGTRKGAFGLAPARGLSAWHPQGGFRPGTRKGAFGLAPARGLSAWHPQGGFRLGTRKGCHYISILFDYAILNEEIWNILYDLVS